jgi:hypothetical protein
MYINKSLEIVDHIDEVGTTDESFWKTNVRHYEKKV